VEFHSGNWRHSKKECMLEDDGSYAIDMDNGFTQLDISMPGKRVRVIPEVVDVNLFRPIDD